MSSRITKSLPFLVAPAEATATGALPLTSMDKAQTKRNTMSSRVTKSLPFVVAPAEATPTGALPLTAMERAHTKRSTMSSRVTKSLPFLVAPAEATPTGALPLTAMDRALASLPMSAMFVYEKPIDQPAETMRRALSRALVPYYPIAGRLTVTGDQLKIVCTGEGVAFVGASASCTLQDARLSGPSPVVTVDDMTMNYVGQHSKDPPLLLMQVTEFSCGGFVVGVTWNHVVTDGAGMVQFLQAVGEFARGLPSYPSILPLRMDLALAELPPPITTMTKALINSKHSDFPSSYITVPLSC